MIRIFSCGAGGSVSFGPHAISHHLEKHGHTVKVYDFVDKYTKHQIDYLLRSFASEDIVCVSTVFYVNDKNKNIDYILDSCRVLGIRTLVGGVNPTKTESDYSIIGSYTENETLSLINKLTKKIIYTPFSISNNDFVWSSSHRMMKRAVLPVEISRHCVFNCKFCSYPSRGTKGDNRNPELFRKTLDSANTLYDSSVFILVCSTFNDSVEKLNVFFESIKNTDYEFAAYIRLDLLVKQRQFWPLIKKHIKYMTFGIETLNWESGKAIGKGTNPEIVKKWLMQVREYFDDCFLYSSFIIGLPGDREQDAISTQIFLSSTKCLNGYSFNSLYLEYPNGGKTSQSVFSVESAANGYTIMKQQDEIASQSYINSSAWVRNDGYSSSEAEKLSKSLNMLEKRKLPSFSMAALRSVLTMEKLRDTWYTGTFGVDTSFDQLTTEAFKTISNAYVENSLS